MSKWEYSEDLNQRRMQLISSGYDAYCLFTATGREVELARELNDACAFSLALPFARAMHKSTNGVKTVVQDNVLPGYVFLFLPKDEKYNKIKIRTIPFRFLRNGSNLVKPLVGNDLRYAGMVLRSCGIFGMSQAIRIGGKTRIISGPLQDLEGTIKEYSKRSRNCRVELQMFNRTISIWLPFEWVDMAYSAENNL